jgi:AraC-like DNA-binding protein
MQNRLHSYVLSSDRSLYIHQRLNSFITEREPFLRVDYSITHLAQDLDIPSYQLSAYINRTMGLNFNEYINRFRVQYCEGLIQKGLADAYNLKGLAIKCGFYNRNTFTSAFKKFTGFTPSRYQRIRKLEMSSKPTFRLAFAQNYETVQERR